VGIVEGQLNSVQIQKSYKSERLTKGFKSGRMKKNEQSAFIIEWLIFFANEGYMLVERNHDCLY